MTQDERRKELKERVAWATHNAALYGHSSEAIARIAVELMRQDYELAKIEQQRDFIKTLRSNKSEITPV